MSKDEMKERSVDFLLKEYETLQQLITIDSTMRKACDLLFDTSRWEHRIDCYALAGSTSLLRRMAAQSNAMINPTGKISVNVIDTRMNGFLYISFQ